MLRVLLLEDNLLDAELIQANLIDGGIECEWVRVETDADFITALEQQRFDLIFADYCLPAFDGITALKIANRTCPEVPFIFISGMLGEELAIETLKSGATDYVLKQGLGRLVPSVKRALREAKERSDRQQVEATLRDTLQKLNFHVENSPLAVIEWDRDFRVTRWCKEAERVFGWTLAEVQGRHPSDWQFVFGADIEAVNSAIARFLDGSKQRHVCRNRNYTKTGSVVHCEWYNSALLDESGQFVSVLSLVLDVTARKQLEAQLRQQAEELEQANRLKDEFLAVLSHELRSPLNPILGWAQLLRTRKFDQATTTRAIETIERNAKVQTQLVEDLLDVSRIIRGRVSLNIAPVSLVSVVDAAIETVRLAAEAKAIQLQPVINSAVGLVSGDPNRLQQVVWNLLTNAIKFTPTGGCVSILLEQKDAYAQLQVNDTGKGISAEFLPYVFDYFRQADGSTTRQQGGLGLGLAIVRHLVELHGGTVQAESLGVEQGATFTVLLPLMSVPTKANDSKWTAPTLERELPGDNYPVLKGLRVLVVDDHADTREFLTVLLEECGAEAIAVASADEAMIALEQMKPDVLVSDVGMPGEDGYSLIRRVRARSPDQGGRIPAAALTAYARVEDRIQALSAGFQIHMPKPINPSELATVVASLAGRTTSV